MTSSRHRMHRPTSLATSIAVGMGPRTKGVWSPRKVNMPNRWLRRTSSLQSKVTMGCSCLPAHAAIDRVLATPFGPTSMTFASNATLSNKGCNLFVSS